MVTERAINFLAFAGASALMALSTPVLGQGASPERKADSKTRQERQAQQREKAAERCKTNRGVDCDSPEGLKEWLLQERTRREAVNDGSRHRLPAR